MNSFTFTGTILTKPVVVADERRLFRSTFELNIAEGPEWGALWLDCCAFGQYLADQIKAMRKYEMVVGVGALQSEPDRRVWVQVLSISSRFKPIMDLE